MQVFTSVFEFWQLSGPAFHLTGVAFPCCFVQRSDAPGAGCTAAKPDGKQADDCGGLKSRIASRRAIRSVECADSNADFNPLAVWTLSHQRWKVSPPRFVLGLHPPDRHLPVSPRPRLCQGLRSATQNRRWRCGSRQEGRD